MLTGFDVYIRKVIENGKPIFPEAICLTEVERLEALEKGIKVESIERIKQTNKGKFYGQYLNDPLDDALLEFKRDWFQPIALVPGSTLAAELSAAPALISIDPAMTLRKSSDYTGICVTKTLSDNNVYVLEAKGIKVNPDMLVNEIFRLVEQYPNIEKVLIETVASQITLMKILTDEMRKRNKFFVIQEVKPESNEVKAVRIRGLIPHYANRRIFHAAHLSELEDQLIEFPKGMHDDIIDALAYQVKFWHPFSVSEKTQDTVYGSYEWWRKKAVKRPSVIGKLFRDIRGTGR